MWVLTFFFLTSEKKHLFFPDLVLIKSLTTRWCVCFVPLTGPAEPHTHRGPPVLSQRVSPVPAPVSAVRSWFQTWSERSQSGLLLHLSRHVFIGSSCRGCRAEISRTWFGSPAQNGPEERRWDRLRSGRDTDGLKILTGEQLLLFWSVSKGLHWITGVQRIFYFNDCNLWIRHYGVFETGFCLVDFADL